MTELPFDPDKAHRDLSALIDCAKYSVQQTADLHAFIQSLARRTVLGIIQDKPPWETTTDCAEWPVLVKLSAAQRLSMCHDGRVLVDRAYFTKQSTLPIV